jgi:NAD(P)-dependent dehydrogenase (short-subunit alcohol dehydrogenase family)
MSELLADKNAIIYGGAGGLGAGVACVFARAGATVFLAGRTRDTLEAIASEKVSGNRGFGVSGWNGGACLPSAVTPQI